jgi:hypothetical protein
MSSYTKRSMSPIYKELENLTSGLDSCQSSIYDLRSAVGKCQALADHVQNLEKSNTYLQHELQKTNLKLERQSRLLQDVIGLLSESCASINGPAPQLIYDLELSRPQDLPGKTKFNTSTKEVSRYRNHGSVARGFLHSFLGYVTGPPPLRISIQKCNAIPEQILSLKNTVENNIKRKIEFVDRIDDKVVVIIWTMFATGARVDTQPVASKPGQSIMEQVDLAHEMSTALCFGVVFASSKDKINPQGRFDQTFCLRLDDTLKALRLDDASTEGELNTLCSRISEC